MANWGLAAAAMVVVLGAGGACAAGSSSVDGRLGTQGSVPVTNPIDPDAAPAHLGLQTGTPPSPVTGFRHRHGPAGRRRVGARTHLLWEEGVAAHNDIDVSGLGTFGRCELQAALTTA